MDEKNNLKEPRHEVLEIPERLPQAKISKELLILGGILILAIGLTVGYYFSQSSKPIVNSVTPSPIPSPKASDEMEGWKTYSSPSIDNGLTEVTFRRPNSWKVDETRVGNPFPPGYEVSVSKDGERVDGQTIDLIWLKATIYKSTDEYINKTKGELSEYKNIDFLGITAVKGIYRGSKQAGTIVDIFFVKDGLGYILETRYLDIFNTLDELPDPNPNILSTFKFVE